MKNPSYDAYFPFLFFVTLLAGKWALPLHASLMVWDLQTQPKIFPTEWTFWANRFSRNHVFEIFRDEPPPP